MGMIRVGYDIAASRQGMFAVLSRKQKGPVYWIKCESYDEAAGYLREHHPASGNMMAVARWTQAIPRGALVAYIGDGDPPELERRGRPLRRFSQEKTGRGPT